MKKFLLSMAVMAFGATVANAASYEIFGSDNYSSIEWTGDNNGYSATVTVEGKTFKIETKKSKSTSNLIIPQDQIRVYKSADLIVTSDDVTMKQVTLTGMTGYAGAQTVSTGWTSAADGVVTTLTNSTGAKDLTFSATANQFRVVKIVVSDEIGEAPVVPEAVKVKSVKETVALASKTAVTIDYPLTVAFVSFSNVFAVDAAGDFIQVYGKNSYKANDIIPAGWEATYELFSGVTPELMPNGTLPEATTQGAFAPKEVAAADITTALVNNVILVKNVVLESDSPAAKENFSGKVGETTLSLRNNYSLASVPAGTYDMTLLVTIYKEAPSLYVISYNNDGSGVAEVEAAENGEVVYYNLQGVKVAEPENGLYIKVQGNKATKVLIRK